MSAKAWGERRSKHGLAARAYPRIERAMRRDRRAGKPLPLTYKGRLPMGGTLTVVLGPAEDRNFVEEHS